MNAIVECPECRRSLQVPDDFFGRKVQCPDCRHMFVAKPPDAAIQVSAASPSPSAAASTRRPRVEEWDERDDHRDDDDLEDVRRGRGRRSGLGLDPDRGGIILSLGIVSLVLAFFSFMLYILPIWIIPMILGALGWYLGQRDLRAMREGTMDPTNQVMTLVGMILSIVGLGLSACVAIFSCAMIGFLGALFFGAIANA